MKQENLRNVAIIAHVDHGKTTMVDRLLGAAHVFRENQQVEERVLDSNDQERERGITILSKNISINYKGVKINVIDTPGHADFGGEVERVLNMADGALLIVDAYEGPKPQTRFVLSHALEAGLRIVVVVNKIDRPNADPEAAVDKVFDLMVELGASDEQLDFPVVYASAVNGYARYEYDDGNMDMIPLLDTILKEIPAPDVDADGPVAMQVCTVDHSSYEGRIGIGRLHSGTIHEKDLVLVVPSEGEPYNAQIRKVYTFENLGKVEIPEAHAGDIVAVIGIEAADIGDVITDRENPVEMKPIAVEEPTMAVVFEASTSPIVGREGDIVGARQLKERLMREKESNISMRIDETEDKSGVRVAGRGVLHLSVLMETMRREGFEFQVGRPQVVYKTDEHGNKLEPIEEATLDVPNDYSGKAIEVMGTAGGIMEDMASDETMTHLVFRIPSRGTMGLKTRILNVTHGEGVLFHHFREYGPYTGEMQGRKNGGMIAMSTDKAVAYALDTLQQRGRHTQLAATNHLVVLPHMTDAEMVLRQPQRRVCQRLLSHHLPFRFVPTAKIPLQKLPVDPLIAFLTRLLRGKRIWRARQLRQPALRHVGHPQVAAAQGIDQEGGRLRVRHLSAVGKVLLQSRVQVCGAALQPLQVAFGAQPRAAVAATDVGHQTRAVARAEHRHRAMRPQMRR